MNLSQARAEKTPVNIWNCERCIFHYYVSAPAFVDIDNPIMLFLNYNDVDAMDDQSRWWSGVKSATENSNSSCMMTEIQSTDIGLYSVARNHCMKKTTPSMPIKCPSPTVRDAPSAYDENCSPSHLKVFYDQSTWNMYCRILNVRLTQGTLHKRLEQPDLCPSLVEGFTEGTCETTQDVHGNKACNIPMSENKDEGIFDIEL